MANHAYIIPKVMPSVKRIDTDLRKIVKERFPEFRVEFSKNETCWMVKYKDMPDPRVLMWCDKFRGKQKCIEFKHGHGPDFGWWFEYEIRERLAELYKCRCYDDGIGRCKRDKRRFNTLSDYLAVTRCLNADGKPCDDIKPGYLAALQSSLVHCALWLPKPLHKYIGPTINESLKANGVICCLDG